MLRNFYITWFLPSPPQSSSLRATWDAASPKYSCQMKHNSQPLGCDYVSGWHLTSLGQRRSRFPCCLSENGHTRVIHFLWLPSLPHLYFSVPPFFLYIPRVLCLSLHCLPLLVIFCSLHLLPFCLSDEVSTSCCLNCSLFGFCLF